MVLLLFFLYCSFNLANALQSAPFVECAETGMRINFYPGNDTTTNDDNSSIIPFAGHVYVKGFFFSQRCHLDYTHNAVRDPFTFAIPYRSGNAGSDCQLKRERVPSGREPEQLPGITYTVVVIVQHHYLFVTSRDKAYSISCFYRDERNKLEQQLEVGELTTQPIQGEDRIPTCTYRVLSAADGNPVQFANIGDQLIHQWSCETQEMGMLVHSCFVRDGLGSEFSLVDERGCVTDSTLLEQLNYQESLNTSTASISAFKFADQMIVYFACQITLCDKTDNGCEGITPPTCNMIPLPSEGGSSIPISEAPEIESNVDSVPNHINLFGGGFSRPNLPLREHGGSYPAYEYVYHGIRQQDPTGWINKSRTLSLTSDSIGYPSTKSIFHAGDSTASRHARSNSFNNEKPIIFNGFKEPKNNPNTTRILLNVAAERLIIFTKDEDFEERTKFENAIRGLDNKQIPDSGSYHLLWICAILAICLLSGLVMYLQHLYYKWKMSRLLEFQKQSFSQPMELSGIWPQTANSSVAASPALSNSRRYIPS